MNQTSEKFNTISTTNKCIKYLGKRNIVLITPASKNTESKFSIKINKKFKRSLVNFLERLDGNNDLASLSKSKKITELPKPSQLNIDDDSLFKNLKTNKLIKLDNIEKIELLMEMGILEYDRHENPSSIHNSITVTEEFTNDVANICHFSIYDGEKNGNNYHSNHNPNLIIGLACVLSTAFFINMLEENELDLEKLEQLIAIVMYFMKTNHDWNDLEDYVRDVINHYCYEEETD